MDGSVFEKRHVYILQEAQKRTRDLQTVGGRDVYVAPATAHKQLHFKKNRHQNTVTVHAILEKNYINCQTFQFPIRFQDRILYINLRKSRLRDVQFEHVSTITVTLSVS